MMTIEELYTALFRRFPEDAVQSAILSYLCTKRQVRYPVAWCTKAAFHAQQSQEIKDRKARSPELSLSVQRPNPDPLRQAIARQELWRAINGGPS